MFHDDLHPPGIVRTEHPNRLLQLRERHHVADERLAIVAQCPTIAAGAAIGATRATPITGLAPRAFARCTRGVWCGCFPANRWSCTDSGSPVSCTRTDSPGNICT